MPQTTSQIASPPVRAVLFDYGLVLSGPPNPAAWARMHTTLAFEPDRFHHEYWVRRHDYDRGTLTGESYWRAIAAEAGLLAPSSETLDILYDADTDLWTDLNPPMVEWAQSLRRVGVRTGILSNMPDRMETGVLRKHPWLYDFDHLTWSHALKLAKPEAAIYQHAAQGLHTPAENILFIDDRAENIAAAREAGMQAIQYTGWPTFLTQLAALNAPSLPVPA